ncbi:MAG: DUF1735 domain-containing protein, partial [Pedobacter sp.]
MKKLIAIFALSVSILNVGCLKDKGFEDEKYGIQIKETKGVSFPESSSSPKAVALVSSTTLQTAKVGVTLESAEPAASDVTVNITVNNALATSMGLTAVPGTAVNIPATITIPAGQRMAELVVSFPNATVLDPNKKYGIGLSISSATGGYKVSSNLKDLVLSISIKNKYDGVYEVTGTLTDANGLYT